MKAKITNITFIVIFMTTLLIPMLSVDFSGGGLSALENRFLATRPPMEYAINNPRDFIAQFDAWFSDNIGFRKRIIPAYKKFNSRYSQGYYLDGSSVVLVGKEGHHFHTHYNQLLPVYQGEPWLDEKQLDDLSVKLNKINQYLGKKGINFITMLCTDKESIYWEYYPDFVIRGAEPTSLDRVVQYLDKHTDIDFFCIKNRLLEKKENYLVFPKTGNIYELCHYNETGAFLAYQELMEHVRIYYPNIESFSMNDVNITYRNNGSSSVVLKHTPNYAWIEPRLFADAVEFENTNSNLPTVLLMRDSYTDWFHNYLPDHFGRTIMHPWNTMAAHFEEYIDLYKPDIVIFESAERGLRGFYSAVMACQF